MSFGGSATASPERDAPSSPMSPAKSQMVALQFRVRELEEIVAAYDKRARATANWDLALKATELQEREKEIDRFSRENTTETSQLWRQKLMLESKLETANADLKASQEAQRQLTTELNRRLQLLEKRDALIDQLKEKLRASELAAETKVVQVQALLQQSSQAALQEKEVLLHSAEVRGQLAEKEQKFFEQMQAELAQAKEDNKALEQRLSLVSAEIGDKELVFQQVKGRAAELLSQKRTLEEDNRRLREDLDRALDSHQSSSSVSDDLRRRLAEQQAALKAARADAAAQMERADAAAAARQHAEYRADELSAELARLRAANEQLQADVAAGHQREQTALMSARQAQESVVDLQAQLAAHGDAARSTEAALAKARSEFGSQIARLRDELGAAQARNESLDAQIRALEAEREQLLHRLAKRDQALDHAKQQFDQRLREHAVQLTEARAELARLRHRPAVANQSTSAAVSTSDAGQSFSSASGQPVGDPVAALQAKVNALQRHLQAARVEKMDAEIQGLKLKSEIGQLLLKLGARESAVHKLRAQLEMGSIDAEFAETLRSQLKSALSQKHVAESRLSNLERRLDESVRAQAVYLKNDLSRSSILQSRSYDDILSRSRQSPRGSFSGHSLAARLGASLSEERA
eukprot:m.19127 g.19127  ORF g.19127 m.19127 type:complete len:640 (+) comp5880_c0_seq1:220-2139(+)